MNDAARAEAGVLPALPAAPAEASHRMHRGRLFRKYLLLILTLVTIALLASGGISIYFTYQETKASLASLQHEKAIAAASRIEQYMHQIEQQLAYAALPQLNPTDVELRRIEFLKLLRQAPEVTDVAQIDASGRERIAVSRLGMDSVGSGKDRSQEPAFVDAKAGHPWYGPVYFRKETEPYVTIALRAAGEHGAVTTADVNLKFIWDVVSRIRIGDKGKAYVVDDKGYLVADPDIGLVLRKTNLSALPHVRAAAAAPRDDPELAMVSTDLGGKRVLTSVAPIESLKWNVFVEQPVSEVYAKLNASILRTALLLLAGLVLSALGALALARGMVRPIRTLEEGAQRIGAGDLDQKIDVRTGDELEALAGQFNRMSSALRESYAGLEQKVDVRTHELKNALEQQTAISEILRVISSSPTDVQPVFEIIAERALKLCDAEVSVVSRVEGDAARLAAVHGVTAQGRAALEAIYPLPLTANTVTTRAMREHAVVQVEDVLSDPTYHATHAATVARFRGSLCTPMIREGEVIGAIYVGQREPARFTESQVDLLQTFADQAVIAIENVRLFNETKEALERQTAMSEILRVISRSPTDVQPVFDTIAAAALGLCDAVSALVFTYDGKLIHLAANANVNREDEQTWRNAFPRPPSRETAAARAILTRNVAMIPDVLEDTDYKISTTAIITGFRSCMAVPLMRDDQPIGALGVGRPRPGPFGPQEIAILQTFADQAVIAIENVRLFNETQEGLAQQTAIAGVLKVISQSAFDLQRVLTTLVETATRLCEATHGFVFRPDGNVYRLAVAHGASPEFEAHIARIAVRPERGYLIGRVVGQRQPVQILDAAEDRDYRDAESRRLGGYRTMLGVPMLNGDEVVGVIVVWRTDVRAFTGKQIDLLTTFADQAAIAIENARLFNETKEALEQQTAVAEILRVISGSPTNVQPVLDAIADRAARHCDASAASIYLLEGNALRHLASRGSSPDPVNHVETLPIDRNSVSGRAFLERRAIQVNDMQADGTEFPASRALARRFDHRTVLVIPLMREGQPFGTILLRRREVRPFGEHERALLQTFGDQAAIALENVRLFNETKEALEQQRASGEVLAAISSSIADTSPVFERILASCERLFAGNVISINLLSGDGHVHIAAYRGPHRDELEQAAFGAGDDRSSGTRLAIARREVLHYPDVANDENAPLRMRRGAAVTNVKAVLAAPMIWEGQGLGAIVVGRPHAGRFSDKEIALLKTFADQAVIAIQNARLFREIEDKSRQLEIANKHKSEFLANMSHELRTPLNAIIGFSEVLLERLFGDVNAKQEDYLKDIHSSGKHLLSLINEILDLSKIEAGRMELEPSPVDVDAAISNALTLIRERAQHHAITIAKDVDPALGSIVADERKLKQILLNLLSNAVKFTPDGGRIDVTARRVAGMAEIAVRDTGIGIAVEDQAAVFEEFRQVGFDYTRKQEGTGLGLALARKFVELHGGRIRVESAPGQGSTFTFTIPL